MTYFRNISTLEELRKQCRDLLEIHHPDNGGNVAQLQEINVEYNSLFKSLKDRHENKATGNDKANTYNNMRDYEEKSVNTDLL